MASASRVVPAILTDDPIALEKMVRQAEGFADYVQVDIMDGQFVPSRSIKARDMAALRTPLAWEAHLMVLCPEDWLEEFWEAGARRIVFHYEATKEPGRVISIARGLGLGVGLALNPGTRVSAVLPIIGEVDNILLLTVQPGFYGSPFLPEVLDKLPELRKARPGIEIGVDGGIKESNIARVARMGVDYVCVGSAIFLQTDPGASYRRLQTLAIGKVIE